MTKKLSTQEFGDLLCRLCDEQAMEIICGKENDLYIPYMMNDAVEAYCHLTDVVIPGVLPDDLSTITAIEISSNGVRNGLFFRNSTSPQGTIWYGSCTYTENLYQYHRIMHCWEKGFEQMRMLVYMIGTIRDKYEYIGPHSCSETEVSLIPLMEYRPFLSFSPISESIEDWYPKSSSGYEAMNSFAMEAGDDKLFRMLKNRGLSAVYAGRIREQMAKSGNFFWLLYGKISTASACYQERIYHDGTLDAIKERRLQIQEELRKMGYQGDYPSFQKEGSLLTVFEEHPFVLPQADDLTFDVHILEYRKENKDQPFRIWESDWISR